MTNEMKLLTALCDALGFDVERVCVNQDDVVRTNNQRREALSSERFGFYVGAVIEPIYEYKLAKRCGFKCDYCGAESGGGNPMIHKDDCPVAKLSAEIKNNE